MNVKSLIILMINILMVFITLYSLLWLQDLDMTFGYTILTVGLGTISVIVLDMLDWFLRKEW